jgi:hypothetical protein
LILACCTSSESWIDARSLAHDVLALTGLAWILLYARMDSEAKWGQIVGNIVSEWTQLLGLVILTKKLIEDKSNESR